MPYLALMGNLGLSGDMQRMRCRLSLTQSTKYCFMLSQVSSCPGRAWRGGSGSGKQVRNGPRVRRGDRVKGGWVVADGKDYSGSGGTGVQVHCDKA